MGQYEEAFRGLNEAQRQAVTTIDGPVLVIAGPGTGKTQLLGIRVAYILKETDTLPQNIICLTFTENGAENMRERLTRFIGKDAYDVNISTYHAFGADLIQRFPEVFAETRLQSPADELTRRQVLRGIVDALPYLHPLKQLRHHLGDLIGTISEAKRALLKAPDLLAIAAENVRFITAADLAVKECFEDFTMMPRQLSLAVIPFERLLARLQPLVPETSVNPSFQPLGTIAVTTLAAAIRQAAETGKTPPLTSWKNDWLAKDDDNRFIFGGMAETRRIEALADVLTKYEAALAEHGWYDFDDMIIRATEALEQKPDLRYSLQERYQYILLDEFQDTNAAQLRLVRLLSDNPVHEGRPNVLAVGDDDQAIYAFQGAQYSNMIDFFGMYRDVAVVNLVENYRSTGDILSTAQNVSEQIGARLDTFFKQASKRLSAAKPPASPEAVVERREFLSDVAQYDWTAHEIKRLLDGGTNPSEIAVLAPKHRYIQPLVPYLAQLSIPVRYEKRENILEAPVVRQLIVMSKLILAINARDDGLADSLWPEVLSFDFWRVPVSELWQLSWQIQDANHQDQKSGWSRTLLESEKEHFRTPALVMLSLAGRVDIETCEQMLDYLIGTDDIPTGEQGADASVRSPLRTFYLSETVQRTDPGLFYDTVSHLTVLRAKLREYGTNQVVALSLRDLLAFIGMYEEAEERMLNTSPYNQQAEAVQLMTVHKAKGLEFEHVFLPSCHDDVWGSAAKGNTNKLTLPANLAPIRHAGATEDERLRILFVAITRAKLGLHLTSYVRSYTGKTTRRLKYLDEIEQPDGSFLAMALPERNRTVVPSDHTAPSLDLLERNWRQRHADFHASDELRGLLADRLKQFQISPTHLTSFIDLVHGGPEEFFFHDLLRFPQAPSVHSQFGNAVHATMEWVQRHVTATGSTPPTTEALQYFETVISKSILTRAQIELETERGNRALAIYLEQRKAMFRPTDKAEHNFRGEGVFVGDAHMTGKTDRLEIDHKAKTITVVDFKTGATYRSWKSDIRLHKYALQLYCYKLLVEGSHTYRGYTVPTGRIEFVEPDDKGRVNSIELSFDDAETARVKRLLQALWNKVQALDLPDASAYDKTIAGIKQFETDLVA